MTLTAMLIEIEGEEDVVRARRAGRDMAQQLGFRTVDQSRVATAISELARNILLYAGRGELLVRPLGEESPTGLEIIARDQGPGIADIERALQDGFSSSRGLGIGLPGTRRLVDEMTIESQVGLGTTITARKWLRKG